MVFVGENQITILIIYAENQIPVGGTAACGEPVNRLGKHGGPEFGRFFRI